MSEGHDDDLMAALDEAASDGEGRLYVSYVRRHLERSGLVITTTANLARIAELEKALVMAADRFADLAEIIEKSGSYDNAGFMRGSARRCRAVLVPAQQEGVS